MPFRMHKFREDARKHHRELAQQNHDLLKITSQITQSVKNKDRFKIPQDSENAKNKKNTANNTHG